MKISREKPCQRLHHRIKAPLYVSVNGQTPSSAFDWSLGGLRIEAYQGEMVNLHDELDLMLELPFQGFQISFDVKGVVVRTESDSTAISIKFIDLSERSFDLMNHFVDDLIRGKMATIDDTICRIDVPVTPISTKPTPNPSEQIPISRLPIKTILMSCFYLLLGGFVFGYLALLFYASYISMEIPSSVISSKIQTLNMPIDGVLKPVNFNVGVNVAEGDVLFKVENTNFQNKINLGKLKIKTIENQLLEAKDKYRIESERIKLYQIVNNTDVKIIRAQLAAKQAELTVADNNFMRVEQLNRRNAISNKQLDEAKKEQTTIAFQVKALAAKLVQATAMMSVSDRRHYNQKEFATDLDMIAVDLQTIYSNLKIEKQQLAYLVKLKNNQVVRAPYNGRITTLLHSINSALPRNEAVLTFEETDKTQVTAFLNQEEILHVGLHDIATVFIPALGVEVEGVVNLIDRSSAFIDKKYSRYGWRDKKEKTALVSLDLLLSEELSSLINAGLPAVVIFNRRTSSPIFSKIFSRIFSSSDKPKPKAKVYKAKLGEDYDSI